MGDDVRLCAADVGDDGAGPKMGCDQLQYGRCLCDGGGDDCDVCIRDCLLGPAGDGIDHTQVQRRLQALAGTPDTDDVKARQCALKRQRQRSSYQAYTEYDEFFQAVAPDCKKRIVTCE